MTDLELTLTIVGGYLLIAAICAWRFMLSFKDTDLREYLEKRPHADMEQALEGIDPGYRWAGGFFAFIWPISLTAWAVTTLSGRLKLGRLMITPVQKEWAEKERWKQIHDDAQRYQLPVPDLTPKDD